MAIQTIIATLQMRRGLEEDFDGDQMTAGEWAVSTDKKYVRMCFAPGLCIRMATYEAFEVDMLEIQKILATCENIQTAVDAMGKLAEQHSKDALNYSTMSKSYAVGGTGTREGEDSDNAKYYSEQAKAIAGGVRVTGVKGAKEETYRDGNVNLTAENIGAISSDKEGDFALKSIYGNDAISLGRLKGSEIKDNSRSIAYGLDVVSSGYRSTALGYKTEALGDNSLSAGTQCKSHDSVSFCFGHGLRALSSYSFAEGCENFCAGYGSHVENAQNICGANYVFIIKSYDSDSKKFVFDKTHKRFSASFDVLEVGSKLYIPNTNFINSFLECTVSDIDAEEGSVTVKETIPTSFSCYAAVLIGENPSGRVACHTEGRCNIAGADYTHAEGNRTEAYGMYSHTEGYKTRTLIDNGHAEGYRTTTNGNYTHAEGDGSQANGKSSHAEGSFTTASGDFSHSEGQETLASAPSSHASGYNTIANEWAQMVCGKFNNTVGSNNTFNNPFIIGNGGSATSRSNAFRVNSSGSVYGKENYNSSGADYAEFIRPWADGNENSEDRVGYFVTVKDEYLHKANEGDYIVGITSGNPSVVGNSDEEYYWRWERDEFNRILYEEVEEYTEKLDDNGDIVVDDEGRPAMIPSGKMMKVMKQSKDYDNSLQQSYIERKDRKEWDYVGMVGVVPVRDDGTCEVGRFCKCGDGGIATLAEERSFDTYMVLDRVSDNIVSVILK